MKAYAFRDKLQLLLNRYSMENGSNTPDFILAEYLDGCLKVFDAAVNLRDRWHNHPDPFQLALETPSPGPAQTEES